RPAGGGVRGPVYGRSDARGAYPAEKPVSPADVAATVYRALGIDPGVTLHDPEGRTHRLCGGKPIDGLLPGGRQGSGGGAAGEGVRRTREEAVDPNRFVIALLGVLFSLSQRAPAAGPPAPVAEASSAEPGWGAGGALDGDRFAAGPASAWKGKAREKAWW